MKIDESSEFHQKPAATLKTESLDPDRPATGAEITPAGRKVAPSAPAALANRFVEMGLSRSLPAFPPDGVPLVQSAPWWQLWARDPRKNTLEPLGAGVLPAAHQGFLNVRPNAPIGQAVFAALLPIHRPETAVEEWIGWTIISIIDRTCPGPSQLLGVLEHLLQRRPEAERVQAWLRILESSFNRKGGFCEDNASEAISVLEAVGRSGLPALASSVLGVLRNKHEEIVLAGIVCLARLGIPNQDLPAEVLLNHLRPEAIERGRWAIGFAETADFDLLTGLLRTPSWGDRVGTLRLAEAVLARGGPVGRPANGWAEELVDLLLAQLQEDDDRDVVRCLAVTLGLALRQAGEASLEKVFEVAAKLSEQTRTESLLNALLLAELPAAAAPRVEQLRLQAIKAGAQAVAALDRVLVTLGAPSGGAQAWIQSQVVVFLQLGLLRLPESIKPWFDAPGRCPEPVVAGLLIERPGSGLVLAFCAAYLAVHLEFLQVLERIWIGAAYASEADKVQGAGSLLAGAVGDSAVSPVELRCSLGHEIGGPLNESPEVVGQLLGLVVTQDKEVRQSAEQLLLCTSWEHRTIAKGCLRWKEQRNQLFGEDRQRRGRFGATAEPLHPVSALAGPLQPVFSGPVPLSGQPERVLQALVLPNKQGVKWARECLDWGNPEALRNAFGGMDSIVLASAFLEASASHHAEARQMAGLLASGAGPRLLETPHRVLLLQRIISLAAHDPDAQVRVAGRQAAEVLGIADKIPNTPAPPPPPSGDDSDTQCSGPQDIDLEALLREMESDLND
jgi:hypothetical protein